MEEVLERQEREIRERRRRRAASKRAQRDLDQQLVMAVVMLDEENQSNRGSHEGRAPNVDRHRHSWGKNLMEGTTYADPRPGTCNDFCRKPNGEDFHE
ncbi:unnamed protein product [Prunus armeniaca]